ncbi:unnamed protein product, partial [Rotaria magnacalcarata]
MDHFKDEPRAGRPRTAVTSENIEVVPELIGSALTEIILHDYLGLKKVTCCWVPHSLHEVQKQDRVDYCLQMLEKFDGSKSNCVYDIITGDE